MGLRVAMARIAERRGVSEADIVWRGGGYFLHILQNLADISHKSMQKIAKRHAIVVKNADNDSRDCP
jgi:hypothetical protein